MKYSDLPYEYRRYSESMGWNEASALSRWQVAEDYREYLIAQTLFLYRKYLGAENGDQGCQVLDRLLLSIRGKKVELL